MSCRRLGSGGGAAPDEGALPDMAADNAALFGLLIGFAHGPDGQTKLPCQVAVRRQAIAVR